MSYESDLVDAMQWVYDNKAEYNIRVVNISMNSTVAQSYHTSPLDAAVEILWFNGIVVVVSAGNNGRRADPLPSTRLPTIPSSSRSARQKIRAQSTLAMII